MPGPRFQIIPIDPRITASWPDSNEATTGRANMDGHYKTNKAALDSRAKATAKRHGLIARKSPRRTKSTTNQGGYALIDPAFNVIVRGRRFNLTAEDVIAICESENY
jgi:hypothetical protein